MPTAPLMWSSYSDTEKDMIFSQLLNFLNNYQSSDYDKVIICSSSLATLKPHLTDHQKKQVLDTFVSTYAIVMLPAPNKFLEALWLYSKDKWSSVPLKFRLERVKFSNEVTLVEQLILTGKDHHIYDSQRKINCAKEIIDLSCQQCDDLDSLRVLKDQTEHSHDNPGLAYLVNPKHNFMNFFAHPRQWQSNRNSNQTQTYSCSKEGVGCMQIFKNHMNNYRDVLNADDYKFLKQTGLNEAENHQLIGQQYSAKLSCATAISGLIIGLCAVVAYRSDLGNTNSIILGLALLALLKKFNGDSPSQPSTRSYKYCST